MSNIDSFKSSLIGGGARSNQFRVALTFPQIINGVSTAIPIAAAQFLCQGSSIPGSDIEKIDAWYRGRKVPLPAERTFEPWKITILNDTNFAFHTAFNQWGNALNNVKNNTGITNPASQTSDLFITALDRNGSDLMTYKMVGAWPSKISELEYDFKNGEVQTFSVTFEYLYWQSDVING